MLIYKDVISGDEVLSDSFNLVVVEDAVYEVKTKMIVQTEGEYVPNNDEEQPGDLDPSSETVNELVAAHVLQETSFDKKSYMAYIKGYMGAVKAHLEKTNPDRVKGFMAGASNIVKKILANFDDFRFFTGESMETEGIVLLQFYKGEETDPYFWIFKDGLIEEKA